MSSNLGDYDLLELHRLARPGGTADAGEESLPVALGAREALRMGQQRELLLQETSALAAGQRTTKPYLTELPNRYAAETMVFEWLDVLINRAGFKNTGAALDFYVEVGWITEDVKEQLRAYMHGFSQVDAFDPDDPGPLELGIEDHVLSLVYVARLAGMS
jgi:flagellar protein FlaE